MPHPKAILETVLYVDDLDAAAAFYENALQLVPIHSDDRMRVLGVSNENFLLLFRSGETGSAIDLPGGTIPPHDGRGRMHVAFSVGKDEVSSWRDHLRAKGVGIESEVQWPNGQTSLYLRDPAGNLAEIATSGLWDR